MNRSKTYHSYTCTKLKELLFTLAAGELLFTFTGPLVIYRAICPNQFILVSLTGQIYPFFGRGNKAQTWCYMDN